MPFPKAVTAATVGGCGAGPLELMDEALDGDAASFRTLVVNAADVRAGHAAAMEGDDTTVVLGESC